MHDIKLDRIEVKLDKVSERLNSIDVTLAAQHVSLDTHIKRTAIIESQLEPIKAHVAMVQGALKFIGAASLSVGLVTALIKLAEMVVR